MENTFTIWTDGSIEGRQGHRASFAALIEESGVGGVRCCIWGTLPAPSTSNAGELTAVVRALEKLVAGSTITVVTDSRYVQRAILEPTSGTSHLDLRAALVKEHARHQKILVRWIKAHSGVAENEFVDQIAKNALKHPEIMRHSYPDSVHFIEIT